MTNRSAPGESRSTLGALALADCLTWPNSIGEFRKKFKKHMMMFLENAYSSFYDIFIRISCVLKSYTTRCYTQKMRSSNLAVSQQQQSRGGAKRRLPRSLQPLVSNKSLASLSASNTREKLSSPDTSTTIYLFMLFRLLPVAQQKEHTPA